MSSSLYDCFAWLEAHPLADWNWDGQFEDVQPCPPYANPTKHNAIDAMFEILRRFPRDKARIEQCRRILRFCEKRFVCWERPANHPQWDAPSEATGSDMVTTVNYHRYAKQSSAELIAEGAIS